MVQEVVTSGNERISYVIIDDDIGEAEEYAVDATKVDIKEYKRNKLGL